MLPNPHTRAGSLTCFGSVVAEVLLGPSLPAILTKTEDGPWAQGLSQLPAQPSHGAPPTVPSPGASTGTLRGGFQPASAQPRSLHTTPSVSANKDPVTSV